MSKSRVAASCCPSRLRKPSFEAALARMRDPALAETMSVAGIRYGRDTAPVTGARTGGRRHRSADPPIRRWPRHRARRAPAEARRYVPISHHRHDLQPARRARRRAAGAGAAIGPGLRGGRRRRRLGAGDRRLAEVLAGAPAATAHSRLAGASRLSRRRDSQPRDPGQQRRLLHLPGRRLHSPPRLRAGAPRSSPSSAGSSSAIAS